MIREILDRALAGRALSREDNLQLLHTGLSGSLAEARETIFEAARELRKRFFGRRIFLYGFLYLSTYCRNNCSFCAFRREHRELARSRKELPETVAAALCLAGSGIHLLDLTTGEDPLFHDDPRLGAFTAAVAAVKSATSLPLMVSPGVVGREGLRALRAAGADWYACYQESFARTEYARLRPGQDFDARLEAKRQALEEGLLIEEGILCGTGESPDTLAESIEGMHAGAASQVRVMEFVPAAGIPLRGAAAHPYREPLIIAILRLNFPRLLIPASLDVEGLSGLSKRFAAGANVVTSIVPPGLGFCGVANKDLDIESGGRTIARVLDTAAASGLEPAEPEALCIWMEARRSSLADNGASKLLRRSAGGCNKVIVVDPGQPAEEGKPCASWS
jgi:methylornithine synthase